MRAATTIARPLGCSASCCTCTRTHLTALPSRLAAAPNAVLVPADVATWLGAPQEATFNFDVSYRPVPLTVHVQAFDSTYRGGGGGSSNAFMFERMLDSKLFGVIDGFSEGLPALVFCASRNGVRTSAERLVADGVDAAVRYGTGARVVTAAATIGAPCAFLRSPAHAGALAAASARAGDARLAEALRHGVGFHSAAETGSDRALVEQLFLTGDLPVLCTTSTLALGVNLPAHLVVVKSTQAWRGAGHGYAELPKATVLQMMGRAGRPQFDVSGVAVIMTQSATRGLYESIAAGADAVESCLQASLIEHLTSEICLGTVTSLGSALRWLRATYWYVRLRSNPGHYALPRNADDARIGAYLRTIASAQLLSLHRIGCVRLHRVASGGSGDDAAASSRGSGDGGSSRSGGGGSSAAAAATGSLQQPFEPASLEEMQRETDVTKGGPGDVRVAPLTPAHVMSRNYLRFGTMSLFSLVREWQRHLR